MFNIQITLKKRQTVYPEFDMPSIDYYNIEHRFQEICYFKLQEKSPKHSQGNIFLLAKQKRKSHITFQFSAKCKKI